MDTIIETAKQFFEACETGKGWQTCQTYCHADASFSSQTTILADIESLQAYCDWMLGLFNLMPDGNYELTSFASDEQAQTVIAVAIFHGTHTGEGGPVPPTNKSLSADYTYNMQFQDGKIKHLTKIWNDTINMQQLGWT